MMRLAWRTVGSLLENPIQRITAIAVCSVLGGLAEFERELIRARTHEGRQRAKAAGRRLGRKPKLTPHQRQEALDALAKGEATQADLARRFKAAAAPALTP